MLNLGLDHLAHAASAAAVLHLPDRAKSVAPTLLTVAGFTPLQVELLVTGFILSLQAAAIALFQLKSYMPFHAHASGAH